MNDLPGSLERLNTRLDQMERRLGALEQRISLLERAEHAIEQQTTSTLEAATAAPNSAPLLNPEFPAWQAGGIFPVLGRAMLGLAGAYLLRALAESHVLPHTGLQIAAMLYALVWITAGARARTALAATIYACTSTLIMAPMLWELTTRFRGMPPVAGAGAIAAFVGVAFAMARGETRSSVLRIANISAAALCLGLAVASHANLPYLTVLLLLTAVCEFISTGDAVPCGRPLLALAADLGVWLLIYIYRAPENTRTDYSAIAAGWLIAPGFLLFAIFASGVAVRLARRQQSLAFFDAAQAMITFLLAAAGLLYFGPALKLLMLGLLCVALAAILYAVLFVWRPQQRFRNQVIFGTWSVALLCAGIWLAVPDAVQPDLFTLAAFAATAAAAALARAALAGQALVFLLLSAWFSGLLVYTAQAFAGTPVGPPSLHTSFAVIGAALCYAMMQVRRHSLRHIRFFSLFFATIAAVSSLSLLVHGAAALAAAAFAVGPHHLALIRSLLLCAAALVLGFSGTRWGRPELRQIGYAVVVLEGLKLLVEDLRHGHLAYVAASVCLFALTLIAIPRVTRSSLSRHKAA